MRLLVLFTRNEVWLSTSLFCLLDNIFYTSPNTVKHRCVSQYTVDRHNSAILPTNTQLPKISQSVGCNILCLLYTTSVSADPRVRQRNTTWNASKGESYSETDRHRQRERTTDLMTTSKILTSLFHTKNLPSQPSWFLNYHAPQQKVYIH